MTVSMLASGFGVTESVPTISLEPTGGNSLNVLIDFVDIDLIFKITG